MPSQYCFLCASDEGVFLDITPDNQHLFDNQLETCLSIKINETIELSNKICYKCAYEIDQCAKFVQKYKKSKEVSEFSNTKTPFCCLCFESIKSGHIFDITKDTRSIFNPLQKVRCVFNEDLTNKYRDSKLICLTCRYNLDVLYDLKRIYQETITNLKALINEEIDYSILPKVYTDVVNRKTTITTFPEIIIYSIESSDTEDNDMARVKKRNNIKLRSNEKLKVRKCDQCHNIVAKDNDMYRFHRTGLTVCKNCWITIDPSRNRTKRQQSNSTHIKLCSVFLKDVLSEKVHETEDDKNNITSDENSQYKEELHVSHKTEQHDNSMKRGKKREANMNSDIEKKPPKIKKSNQNKKSIKKTSDIEQLSSSQIRPTRKKKSIVKDQDSDSDVLPSLTKEKYDNKSDNCIDLTLSPDLEVENTNKSNRKRLRTTLETVSRNIHLESSDESSNESNEISINKIKKARQMSSTSKDLKNKIRTRRNKRSSSISDKEKTPELKNPILSELKTEYTCDKCDKKFDTRLLSAEHKLTHLKQFVLKLNKVIIPNIEEKQEEDSNSQENNIAQETESTSVDKNVNNSQEIDIIIKNDSEEKILNFSRNKNDTEKKERDKKIKKLNEDIEDKCINDKSSNLPVKNEDVEEIFIPIQNNEKIVTEELQQSDEKIISDEKDEEDQNTKISIDKNVDTSKDKDIDIHRTIATGEEHNDLNTENDDDIIIITDTEKITVKEEISSIKCDVYKDPSGNKTFENKRNKSPISLIDTLKKDNEDHSENRKNHLENNCEDNESKIIKDEQEGLNNVSLKSSQDDSKDQIEKDDPKDQIGKDDSKDQKEKDDPKDQKEKDDPKDRKEKDDPKDQKEKDHLKDQEEEDDLKNQQENDETSFDVIEEIEILNDEKDVYALTILQSENSENQQNENVKQNKETDVVENNKSITEDNVKTNLSKCKYKIKNDNESDSDISDISTEDDNDLEISSESKKLEEVVTKDNSKDSLTKHIDDLEQLMEEVATNNESQETLNHTVNSPIYAANEILKEVFDLATAEVQKREDTNLIKSSDAEIETLENISREIRNSADMPSLDPICTMETDNESHILDC